MKKVFSLILIALLLFTGVVPTYAESKEESELLEQNIKNVSSYAVSFIKAFTTCSDYASGDVITIQTLLLYSCFPAFFASISSIITKLVVT